MPLLIVITNRAFLAEFGSWVTPPDLPEKASRSEVCEDWAGLRAALLVRVAHLDHGRDQHL